MRVLKNRLAKIEKAKKPQHVEPLVIERSIIEPDGTVSEVIRKDVPAYSLRKK